MSWRFSDDLDWMKLAACVGIDGDIFFGGRRGGRPAIGLLPCSRCPVRSECHEYAVSLGPETFGIWGGRSASDS